MKPQRLVVIVVWSILAALAVWPPVASRAQVVVRTTQRSALLPAIVDPATGDTVAVVALREVYCFNRKHFKSTTHEREYWRMVNDVHKTLPIAKDARRLLAASYDTLQTMNDRQQRAYFKQMERELLAEYKPRLKKLNYRQGKLLVRLIDRELGSTSYVIIRDYLGRSRAFFWQTFGRLFGVSLKSEWEPDGRDKELEDICLQVEQGLI